MPDLTGGVLSTTRHFTASCIVLDPAHAAVLLIDHRGTHQWQIPGGHIDPDETGAEAALREVAEETGVTANLWVPEPLTIPGGVWHPSPYMTCEFPAPSYGDIPAHHHIDLLYIATATAGVALPQLDEVHAAQWWPIRDLDVRHRIREDVPVVVPPAWRLVRGGNR